MPEATRSTRLVASFFPRRVHCPQHRQLNAALEDTMNKLSFVRIFCAVFILWAVSACANSGTATPKADIPTNTAAPTVTPLPPTSTPTPLPAPTSTATQPPTDTPRPELTPTIAPSPTPVPTSSPTPIHLLPDLRSHFDEHTLALRNRHACPPAAGEHPHPSPRYAIASRAGLHCTDYSPTAIGGRCH